MLDVNRETTETMIREDIEWLESCTDDTLERKHIIDILSGWVDIVYGRKENQL